MLDQRFVAGQRRWLEARLKSKTEILQKGGERAASHSWNDITRIKFALQRIDENQYGLCTNCGISIEIGRLSQIPETPFCSSCATSVAQQPRTH